MLTVIILIALCIYGFYLLIKLMHGVLPHNNESPKKVFISLLLWIVLSSVCVYLMFTIPIHIPSNKQIIEKEIVIKRNNSWYYYDGSLYNFVIVKQDKAYLKTVDIPIKVITWDKNYAMFVLSRHTFKNKFWLYIVPNTQEKRAKLFTPKD